MQWVDPNGRQRFWESCERTTRSSSGVDGVAIVAKTAAGASDSEVADGGAKMLVISQYRPPLESYCLEIPAGLIDPGETAETAALRELKEETGYTGKLVTLSPMCFNDPGITNANMMMAVVEIDLDAPENVGVQQELHDGEFIKVEFAPWNDLLSWILEKKEKEGCSIDARLLSFAMGIQQAHASLLGGGEREATSGGDQRPSMDDSEGNNRHQHGGMLVKKVKLPKWMDKWIIYATGAATSAVLSFLLSHKK